MVNEINLSSEAATYKSGSIKWSGLASGTDFQSVVDQLVELERGQINRLENWRQEWVDKMKSISGLDERMNTLKYNSRDMDSESEFYSRSATSSNSSVVTVTNTSTVDPGTHSVEVGSNIPGKIISKSYESGLAVGGAAGDTLSIKVGDQTLSLTGVSGAPTTSEFNVNGDLEALKDAINAADDAADDILEDVEVIEDKDRGGTIYQRLLITAKVIVSSEEISVTNDPTNLCLNQNAVDPVYEKTWLGSVATPTLGASAEYTGSTNKTFTFMAGNSGELGTDDITIRWADDENNSGEFVIEAADYDPTKEYEVFQGVTLSFAGAGDRIVTNESFTVDVHSPVFQHAQDKGLAQVERRVHEGFADLISPVTENPGDFVYRYEGVETTINLPSDASLQNLVDKINDDPNNPGIVASIIDDGSGTATRYHLALTGKDTGAEHTIEIVSNTLDKFDASDAAFEYSQRATNSMVRVDGFPADSTSYIQRSGNTVADVIDGVVLDLHNAGSSVVTISNDIDEIQSKIEQLVQSVNFVNDYIKQETKYNSETGESGIMIGNYTYDIVRNSLNNMLTTSVPGIDPEEAAYTHLSQIGISTDPDQDGRWVVDSTKLRNALNENLEDVAQLFVQDEGETIDGVAHQLHQKMTDLTDSKSGIANVLLQNYDGIVSEIDNKIAAEERRVAMVRQRLEEKFARLEATLGQLQGQSSYLEAQLEKMPTIGK